MKPKAKSFLQPMLPIRQQPLIQQPPALQSSHFFQKHLLPRLQSSPQQTQIEQFLPFDPTIIDIFDEQQLCTYPIPGQFIVPYQRYVFGGDCFGGEVEERVRKIVGRVKEKRRLADKEVQGEEWIVRVYTKLTKSDTTLYKTYTATQTTQHITLTQTTTPLPIPLNQQQAPSILSYNLQAIIFHPTHNSNLPTLQICLTGQSQSQRGNEWRIYQVGPVCGNEGGVDCGNLCGVVRQFVLLEMLGMCEGVVKGGYWLDNNAIRYCSHINLPESSQTTLTHPQILQLTTQLQTLHKQSLSLTKPQFTTYQTPPNKQSTLFTNLTQAYPLSATPSAAREEIGYDWWALAGRILEGGYQGVLRDKLEEIVGCGDMCSVVQLWRYVIYTIHNTIP